MARNADAGFTISGMATKTAKADERTPFDTDQENAYAGRLGHVDDTYTDPDYGGTVGPPTDEPAAKAETEPEAEPEAEPDEESEEEADEEAEEAEAEDEEADEDVEEIDVESLTIAGLCEQLDALGVEYQHGERKDDLKAKLYAALE